MFLVGTAVDDQNSLVAVLLPGEDLRGRVEQIDSAKVVVGDVEFGVAAVQRQLATKLRNGQISLTGGKSDSVVGVLEGVESSVPDHEEFGDVAVASSDGKVCVASVAAIDVGAVLVLCCQVGGRCLEEIGFKLGFAVFLAVDEAFLANDCSIVVARVSAWMSKIAPWKKLVMVRRWSFHG
jgi:hypothetical protein